MKRLALAPHRLYFFLGALTVLFLFTWWWVNLHTDHAGIGIALHAVLMPLGIFPLFILGFTFTAGPRWLAVDASQKYFLATGLSYFAGIVLVAIGSVSLPVFLKAGFSLMLLAWLSATWRWAALISSSRSTDKKHPMVLLAAMVGGALALLAALLWSSGVASAWLVTRQLAFFSFLLPVFLVVCHRMLPFFSNSVLNKPQQPYLVWRPFGLLWFWLSACVVLTLTGVLAWPMLEAITACLLALSFAYTSWRWGIFASLKNRLLAMLHLSFAWLSLVFVLHAASAMGFAPNSAALHALGLGFMATMLVGFVSRVSFGHSGRPLQVSNALWVIYLGLHLAAILRVLASLLALPWLISYSATAWLVLLGSWVLMMLPIYLQARQDGQAG